MGSVTSMAPVATPGPVSLAATLNLPLLPQDKRAIPISQDFNKDDMGRRARASVPPQGSVSQPRGLQTPGVRS